MRGACSLVLLLLGCAEKVEELSPAPAAVTASASASSQPSAEPAAGQGSWFAFDLPAGWAAVTLETEVERGASEGMWRGPKASGGANLVVFRPVPFDGDAQAFAEQSLFAYRAMGIGDMTNDGDKTVGGVAAKRFHGTIAVGGRHAEVAYWFFVRDGAAAGIQCGGSNIRHCDALVKSFRFTAPLPRPSVTLPKANVQLRDLPGFKAEVRDDWQVLGQVAYPDALFQLRAGEPVAGNYPSAVIRRRPWKDPTKAWRAGVVAEIAAEGSKVVAEQEITFLGKRAAALEVQAAAKAGGLRTLVTGRREGDNELRVECMAAPLVFEQLRADCLRLFTTLRAR